MYIYTFLVFVSGFPLAPYAVKVNIQGSVSLGSDVMDTLTQYLRTNEFSVSGRRVFTLKDKTTDTITQLVTTAFLCHDLNFWKESQVQFVNAYVIALTKTVEKIFEGLLQASNKADTKSEIPKAVVFEDELKLVLQSVRKILVHANKKLEDNDESFIWIDLIKKINAKFQDKSITFASDRLQGNAQEISEVKQKLTQKIIIDTNRVQLEYEFKLCIEENICIKTFEFTKTLSNLLKQLQKIPDAKTKLFIKYFYETLPDTSFYYRISDVTSSAFQAILNDMAYADTINTKSVLLAVQNTVDARLNSISSKTDNSTGRDVKLAHVILSDMDHFYSQRGVDPFHRFMEKLYDWTSSDARFSSPIRQVMRDIANTLSLESVELVTKLVNEVRVFLEITVDPEK